MTATTPSPRLLLLVEGEPDAALLERLRDEAGLTTAAVVEHVTASSADTVAASLPDLLEGLPALEIAVLAGPLASETWRRHSAFQLHVTLIDAPEPGALTDAVRGAVAMLG